MASIEDTSIHDGLKHYQDYRYYSSSEACCRLFYFPLNDRSPAIKSLRFHSENEELINFDPRTIGLEVGHRITHLTAWFEANRRSDRDLDHRTILFSFLPKYYTLNDKFKLQKKIKQKQIFPTLGRIHTIHPLIGQTFQLTIVLYHVLGATGSKYFKTIIHITKQ